MRKRAPQVEEISEQEIRESMREAQMKLEHLLDHYERLEKSYPHYVSRIPNQVEATMIEIKNYPEIY